MSTTTIEKTGEGEEKKGTLRSTVYTIAVLVEVIWMIFLVLELIWILTQVLNVDQDKPNWDVIVVVSLVKSYISTDSDLACIPESPSTCDEEDLALHLAPGQDTGPSLPLKSAKGRGPNLLHVSRPSGFDLLGSL